MYKLSNASISYRVSTAQYGKQDLGISPKGASDQLSFKIAYILLGEPKYFICEEIIHTNKITILEDSMCCITGAHYESIYLNDKKVDHSSVLKVTQGDSITFENKTKGFRTYFMCTHIVQNCIGKKLENFEKYFTPYPKKIRVIKNAEYNYLNNPKELFSNSYKISHNSNLMGLKLECNTVDAKAYDIISSSVCDGTIQLTKDGPIILMRHRQTSGGYPRILQVISVDINLLAQYKIGEFIQFELISLELAREILLDQKRSIKRFKKEI